MKAWSTDGYVLLAGAVGHERCGLHVGYGSLEEVSSGLQSPSSLIIEM